MGASFEEKSVWIQLVGMTLGLGAYFFVAGRMLLSGVTAMPAYAAVFMVATALMVVFLVAGHLVAALASRPEGRDERDRLIEWKSESGSSWILAVGVLGAVTGMCFSVSIVWIANALLVSLFLSEIAGYVLRLAYYRRGM